MKRLSLLLAAAFVPAPARGQAVEPSPAPGPSTPALECTVPSEVPAGGGIPVVCLAEASSRVTKTTLHFRPSGHHLFFETLMVGASTGRWEATIPGHMLSGRSVQLYVEGANRARKPVAAWGAPDNPYAVSILAGPVKEIAPPSPTPSTTPTPSSASIAQAIDENPLEERRSGPPEYRRRRLWASLMIGDGIGWSLEKGPRASPGTSAPSLDLLVLPEVGVHLGPRLAISLAGRHQLIQQPTRDSTEASSAHLGLVRVLGFSGVGRHRLYGVVSAGAGSGFRLVLDREDNGGRPSLRGGPFVAGLGAGYVVDLERSPLAFTAQVDSLAGFPDAAVVLDLRLGLAAYF